MALLVAEPLNPSVAHAVRVDLLAGRERTFAGYLPDETSRVFHEMVKSAMDIGALPLLNVAISARTPTHEEVTIRLVHLAGDPARPLVTDELVARTNDRLAEENGGP